MDVNHTWNCSSHDQTHRVGDALMQIVCHTIVSYPKIEEFRPIKVVSSILGYVTICHSHLSVVLSRQGGRLVQPSHSVSHQQSCQDVQPQPTSGKRTDAAPRGSCFCCVCWKVQPSTIAMKWTVLHHTNDQYQVGLVPLLLVLLVVIITCCSNYWPQLVILSQFQPWSSIIKHQRSSGSMSDHRWSSLI